MQGSSVRDLRDPPCGKVSGGCPERQSRLIVRSRNIVGIRWGMLLSGTATCSTVWSSPDRGRS